MNTSAINVSTPTQSVNGRVGMPFLIGYLVLYAASLWAMHVGGFELLEPIFVLAVLGVGFSLAAWVLTVRVSPQPMPLRNPETELTAIITYLVPLVAFVTWGFAIIHRWFPSDPSGSAAIMAAKLTGFVIIPALIVWRVSGYTFQQLAPISFRRSHLLVALGMSVLSVGFQAVAGRGLREISSAHIVLPMLALGLPITFVWLALEAGVVEEFFFRVLLQTRLASVLKSEMAALVLMSLIFGLVHAPGIYLRTGLTQEGLTHPSLLMAVGYSIVITSVAGFFLGVLWARTRNFAVVVIVHAAADLLPNFLPTLRGLRILS